MRSPTEHNRHATANSHVCRYRFCLPSPLRLFLIIIQTIRFEQNSTNGKIIYVKNRLLCIILNVARYDRCTGCQ